MVTVIRPPVIERDLEAVAAWLDALIAAAPRSGPIPILGCPAWVTADELTKLASLARYTLHTLHELDPAVIAARLAAEIEAGRRNHAAAIKDASKAISDNGNWSTATCGPSHAELMRRRYPPNGDPELWVRHGPESA